MANLTNVVKAGNLMIARLDDGTKILCYPTPGDLWLAKRTVAPPPNPDEPTDPDPTPTGKWVHPLPGAVFTSGYGESRGAYLHVGVDLSTTMTPPGAPVLACTDMKITVAIEDGTGGLPDAGSYVKGHSISGPEYSFSHFHLHPGTVAVSVGQTVAAGTQLGLEGESGNSTGPHLHLEIWNGHMPGDFFYWGDGTPPDPQPILAANGVNI